MKKPIGKNSQISLINEYKGNLFEFLVASYLAREIGIEKNFLESLVPNFHELLRFYQNSLYQFDSELISFLDDAAKKVSSKIISQFSLNWEEVKILGKISANDKTSDSEADIILKNKNKTIEISLKLAKKGSYLNTKSAGARSFLSKYFQKIEFQEKLNEIQDQAFATLSAKIESFEGLDVSSDFFYWKEKRLSELPGDLDSDQQKYLFEYYETLTNQIFSMLEEIKEKDNQLFKESLYPLMGFAKPEIIQVVMFHEYQKAKKACSEDVFIYSCPDTQGELFLENAQGTTSFYIFQKGWRLQIRVKPMNIFTTKAIKINCSLRYE